jgi:serine/threonine protein kinase
LSKLKATNLDLISNLNNKKSKNIKTIRTDQLSPVINDDGEAVILGKGCFGVCKLMRLHVSGESVLVAAKTYDSFVKDREIIHEMSILTQISHECFPFVFGVALDIDPKLLIMEFCGLTDSKCCTVLSLLKGISPISLVPKNWLDVLYKCCDGFYYLNSIGIVHCDIKSDNTMVIQGSAMFEPKIIDLNKANYISDCVVKKIPGNRREFCKRNYQHIDPGLYDVICKQRV